MTYSQAVSAVAKSRGLLAAWRPSAVTQFVAPGNKSQGNLIKRDGSGAHTPTSDDQAATDWQVLVHGSFVSEA